MKVNKFIRAYGIKELFVNLEGGNSKDLGNQIIYAPNGVFKTSFARAMKKLSEGKGKEVTDRLYDTKFKCDIEIDGVSYDESSKIDNIIVYSRELLAEQGEQDALLSENADIRDLATSQDDIKRLEVLIKRVKPIADGFKALLQSCDFNEGKLSKVTQIKTVATISGLGMAIRALAKADEDVDTSLICNNNINVIKNLSVSTYEALDSEEFKQQAESYLRIFNETLKSIYFDDKLNDISVQELLKALKDTEFLNEERFITFHGDKFTDFKTFETRIHELIKQISDKEELFTLRDSLLKSLGKLQEADKLIEAIRTNPAIVEVLAQGRENILFSHLKRNNTVDLEAVVEELDTVELKETALREKAVKRTTEFDIAIDEYIKRFRPVIRIKIENRTTSLFDEEYPHLVFSHDDKPDEYHEENKIRGLLSSGQKTALDIIRFIVAYKRIEQKHPIVILDDIVETFDYRNRAAFIQYIDDINKAGSCVIVLTHNYEFYRTLKKSVNLVASVAKVENDRVIITKDSNIDIDFCNLLNVKDEKGLFYALPFIRELCLFDSKSSPDFLVNCFHYKEDSGGLTIRKLLGHIKSRIDWFGESLTEEVLDKTYLEVLSEVIARIKIDTIDFYDAKKKIVLAIGCRIFLEQKVIGEDLSRISGITINQTRKLLERHKKSLSLKSIDLLERTLLFTPEFVHVNSFMYEPLIDIPPDYLIELYEEIDSLKPEDIWQP